MSQICSRCKEDLPLVKYEGDSLECKECKSRESRKAITQRKELGVVFKIPLPDKDLTFEERARKRALEAI